jgi:hypothetical protein
MSIFMTDVNWSKDSLVEYAIQKMGITGTAAKAMSKHDLIVSVFIKRCFNNNRYVGDYGWIRQTVAFLKKKAGEKGLNIGMCGKQELLNKLFTHAYNTTTIERSLYLKPLFLREYERLTSKSLQSVVQRNFLQQEPLVQLVQQVLQDLQRTLEPLVQLVQQVLQDLQRTLEPLVLLVQQVLQDLQRTLEPLVQLVRNFQYFPGRASQDVNIYGEDTVVDQNNSAELMKELTCVVCVTNKRAIMFSDCGHFATCNECTKKLEKKCPICRLKNVNIRKIFL